MEIKGEVVLNDFYSFASASLLFISLLFSLSPTVGRFSSWFSEAVFLAPLSAALCLSLDFFTGLPCPAAVAPDFLGLERGTLYLSTYGCRITEMRPLVLLVTSKTVVQFDSTNNKRLYQPLFPKLKLNERVLTCLVESM